jgi:integrase
MEIEILTKASLKNDNTGHVPTLNDFLETYLEGRADLKESTKQLYRQRHEHMYREAFGAKKLNEITRDDIVTLYASFIRAKKYGLATIQMANGGFGAIFEEAKAKGFVQENPAHNIMKELKKKIPAIDDDDKKIRVFTAAQQVAFLNFIRTSAHYRKQYAFYLTLLGTGCRIGEALALTWNDVDFDNGIISIDHQLVVSRRKYVSESEKTNDSLFRITTPKTKKSKRVVPMLDDVRTALLEAYQHRTPKGIAYTLDGYSDFIFLSRSGELQREGTIYSQMKNIIKAYNEEEMKAAEEEGRTANLLPMISPHKLRHSFCTRLFECGMQVQEVQGVLGHSQASTTMNIYSHLYEVECEEGFKSFKEKANVPLG